MEQKKVAEKQERERERKGKVNIIHHVIVIERKEI